MLFWAVFWGCWVFRRALGEALKAKDYQCFQRENEGFGGWGASKVLVFQGIFRVVQVSQGI